MSATNEPAFDWSQAASLLGDDPHAVEPDMAAIVRELVEQAVVQFKDLRALNAETDRKTVSSQAHAPPRAVCSISASRKSAPF